MKKIFNLILVFALIAIFTSGCEQINRTEGQSTTDEIEANILDVEENVLSVEENKELDNIFKIDEVSKRNTPDNCWIIINKKIYDISDIAKDVETIKKFSENCGKDVSEIYIKSTDKGDLIRSLKDSMIGLLSI